MSCVLTYTHLCISYSDPFCVCFPCSLLLCCALFCAVLWVRCAIWLMFLPQSASMTPRAGTANMFPTQILMSWLPLNEVGRLLSVLTCTDLHLVLESSSVTVKSITVNGEQKFTTTFSVSNATFTVVGDLTMGNTGIWQLYTR